VSESCQQMKKWELGLGCLDIGIVQCRLVAMRDVVLLGRSIARITGN